MAYNLIYHAGIPGRAEFARLFFEATATPYVDQAITIGQSCIQPYLKKGFPGCPDNPTPLAPPILTHGDVVLSQTGNILLYLAARLPAIDLDAPVDAEPDAKKAKPTPPSLEDPSLYHANELALTVLDFINEVHYYEAQKDAALVRTRVFRDLRTPKFFGYFESNIEKTGGDFLTKGGPTYADLALFHAYDGMLFAFPNLMARLKPQYPLVTKLYEKVKAAPRIEAYLNSPRRMPYSHGIFRLYPELDPKA
ncbi:hypothetical protein RQP46_001240 [Phenoliferia psychrophenolica]